MNTGVLPDGSQPWCLGFIRILTEEIVKELQLNSKIMVEIPPGSLMGQAGSVPVVSTVPIQGSAILL